MQPLVVGDEKMKAPLRFCSSSLELDGADETLIFRKSFMLWLLRGRVNATSDANANSLHACIWSRLHS